MLNNISANRMTLLKLKKRLTMARRGHRLMKQKLDELIHIFQQEKDIVFNLRRRTDDLLMQAYRQFMLGKGMLREETINSLLCTPLLSVRIETQQEQLLNLRIPRFQTESDIATPPYGLLETNVDLDNSLMLLMDLLQPLVELSAQQRKIELLSREIETTRRRVNALEYILIPQIEGQLRFIKIKLDEVERGDISRLMRIKSIIRGENEEFTEGARASNNGAVAAAD